MATAEMDFHGAYAIPMGDLEEGFKILMENVLHFSRLFNTFCVLGMARRAFHIALAYAKQRRAFGHSIIEYPLVQENLARVKAENTALLASIFAAVKLQDASDLEDEKDHESKLLLRLLANLNKYLSALWSVEHIHHSLDVLAGNGTIETFSTIPRLLRDSIVCENWEGTHNVLRMQILRDILRYHIDEIFLEHIQFEMNALSQTNELKKSLEILKRQLQILKKSEPELQAFLIREVVDRIGVIYAGMQLLKEALNQRNNGVESKMKMFAYFSYLHLQEDKKVCDNHHLSLINSVINLNF